MGSMDDMNTTSFKINFSSEGLVNLRDKVNDKLKHFMGDYTDDTLVDYVIILLRNGRHKEEAKNELNMFLGDESHSFVSWLWDHLASNLDLYTQSHSSSVKDAARTIPVVDHQVFNTDSDRDKSNNLTKRRRNSEWTVPVRKEADHPLLMSSVIDDSQIKEKVHHKATNSRRRHSRESSLTRKRSHPDDDHQQPKKETVSQATATVTRRLLQSAMRDAVESLKPSNSVTEPSLKRLRSVVSTPASVSSVIERPRRIQSVARVLNPMKTVIKAVEEAAQDAKKAKSSRNVFDRLGSDMDVSELIADQVTDKYFNYNQIQEETQPAYLQKSNYAGVRNTTMLESEIRLGYDDDINGMDSRIMRAASGGNMDDGLMVRGPPLYQESRQTPKVVHDKKNIQKAGVGKSAVQLMKENSIVANGNAKHVPDVQRETQKMQQSPSGAYTAGPTLEDADSRTIFVSNVNFAATKDSLSQHFNKFGEVLKVVIVTDAATGQPKGSAFVEFMRKEAADSALSLDGTSFMSRMVKVVKKNAAPQEAAMPVTWARGSRGSPYAGSKFGRVPFPRGSPYSRPGLPIIKPGAARSFQWKRGSTDGGANSFPGNISVRSPATPRSLTYVRPEAKPQGNSGSA
ncbi:hypothetical protein ACFE04_002846 [Oxalis oulophora]